mmetsp:Transcript_50594/g.45367  ORF Transcript_50594/g.45367 Transcript_50594/m.45367 type:complete len:278 (+) Transcript_50594:134-967(+)
MISIITYYHLYLKQWRLVYINNQNNPLSFFKVLCFHAGFDANSLRDILNSSKNSLFDKYVSNLALSTSNPLNCFAFNFSYDTHTDGSSPIFDGTADVLLFLGGDDLDDELFFDPFGPFGGDAFFFDPDGAAGFFVFVLVFVADDDPLPFGGDAFFFDPLGGAALDFDDDPFFGDDLGETVFVLDLVLFDLLGLLSWVENADFLLEPLEPLEALPFPLVVLDAAGVICSSRGTTKSGANHPTTPVFSNLPNHHPDSSFACNTILSPILNANSSAPPSS